MPRPQNLRYLKSHEWCRVEGPFAYIGITDYAVSHLSDLVFLDLPEVNTDVQQNEPFGEIESVKAVSDLYAPVTGAVVERNEKLMQELDLLAKDPYGQGWMLKVRMEKPAEVNNLLDDAAYQKVVDADSH
ncbi:MAG TPA: glycine cleavage system protein GcvH [Planctomycetota bacterium]|nr:glycine cleavage system protein GcvH [Planctomycetota bacterium]